MKTIVKAALGALALASLGAAAATPANAASSFGFSFGTGPSYGGGYYADPCFGPYRYRPYYCRPAPVYRYYDRPYYGRSYYRPYGYRYRDHYRGWDRRYR